MSFYIIENGDRLYVCTAAKKDQVMNELANDGDHGEFELTGPFNDVSIETRGVSVKKYS